MTPPEKAPGSPVPAELEHLRNINKELLAAAIRLMGASSQYYSDSSPLAQMARAITAATQGGK